MSRPEIENVAPGVHVLLLFLFLLKGDFSAC